MNCPKCGTDLTNQYGNAEGFENVRECARCGTIFGSCATLIARQIVKCSWFRGDASQLKDWIDLVAFDLAITDNHDGIAVEHDAGVMYRKTGERVRLG